MARRHSESIQYIKLYSPLWTNLLSQISIFTAGQYNRSLKTYNGSFNWRSAMSESADGKNDLFDRDKAISTFTKDWKPFMDISYFVVNPV